MERFKHNESRLEDVNLRVNERPGHGIFFEFNPTSQKATEIYNRVIESVLSKVGSPTPHGSQTEGQGYQPGYQNWQIEAIDIKQARELIPTIHALARKLFEESA